MRHYQYRLYANWFGGIAIHDYFTIAKKDWIKDQSSYETIGFIRMGVDNIPIPKYCQSRWRYRF